MILARPRLTVPAHHAERFELPAGYLKGTLRGDGAADVACVALAAGILDVQPDRVQLNSQILDVNVGQVSEGRNVRNRHRLLSFVELCMWGSQRSSATKNSPTSA